MNGEAKITANPEPTVAPSPTLLPTVTPVFSPTPTPLATDSRIVYSASRYNEESEKMESVGSVWVMYAMNAFNRNSTKTYKINGGGNITSKLPMWRMQIRYITAEIMRHI